jgi:TPR repeat protein
MATETCENCKRIIGELEQAYTWQSHILCKECYARLSNPTVKQPISVDVHAPVIQPPPQRSLIKSTLIVMATVVSVIVVVSIILSMPSILSQCSRQITIYKANNGDARAQYLRGLMCQCGDGVPRDYKEAINWYTKAAEQGYASAQSVLGEMYSIGSDLYEGVPQDYNGAAKWYTKAAEQGYASAQSSLGEMYYNGYGVPQDSNEAIKWCTKAAEQGYPSAQFLLGKIYYGGYYGGKDFPHDYSKAAEWCTKAAEEGYTSAQSLLGEMYYFGRGVPKDYNEAYKWALLAEMNGDTGNIHQVLKEMLADKITPTQIAEAHKLAREFTEKQEKEKTGKNTKTSGVK